MRRIAVLLLVCACQRHEPAAEADGEKAEAKEAPAFALVHEADGTTVIVASDAARKAAGIEAETVRQRDVPWIAVGHGVLREDPSRVAVVRAPFGGVLAAGDVAWPELGAKATAAVVLARLLPRAQPLTPSERADLQAKLTEADATKTVADAELTAARAELARVKELNAHDKGASDRAVETAALAVTAGEAKLRAAAESAGIYQRLIAAPLAPLDPVALQLARGETVLFTALFVGARIGESVEAGQELLRVADLGQLLATVTLPAGSDALAATLGRPPFTFASATVRTDDGTSAPAAVLGQAPDSAALGRTFLLRVDVGARALRPGQAVVAEMERAGEPLHGLAVPESALVRYAGDTWVYVEIGPGRFVRGRATVERFVDSDVVLTDVSFGSRNAELDTKIVRVGAASLLSVEQLKAGGGGE